MINRVGVLVFFVAFVVRVSAGFGGVNRFFVCGLGFDLSALGRAETTNFLDGFGFLDSVVGNLDFIDGASLFNFLLFVFLVVFVERRAANDCIGRGMRLNFVLLRVDDAGSESGDFVVAQRGFGRDFITSISEFQLVSFFAVRRRGDWAFDRAFRGFGIDLSFGARTGEQPAWQAGRASWRVRRLRTATRDRFIDVRLRLVVRFVFDDGR